jgi:catechol 2,3-dioxygenase-like lactoylglutathione lyase family enzyme
VLQPCRVVVDSGARHIVAMTQGDPTSGPYAAAVALRMNHAVVVVDDLDDAIAFFVELGLEMGDRGTVEGPWVDRALGLDGVRGEFAFVDAPDGHSRLELAKFHSPAAPTADLDAPANAPGIRLLTFTVDDLDDVLARLRTRGTELVGRVEDLGPGQRLCYVRGPVGIIIELAEQLG